VSILSDTRALAAELAALPEDAIIIVCGGRKFTDYTSTQWWLSHLPAGATIRHGAAAGADRYAERYWKQLLGRKTDPHPADWQLHGKAARHFRNAKMLVGGVDAVIAFPGAAGVADMCQLAERASVPVFRVE
jgi:hypothetical protein